MIKSGFFSAYATTKKCAYRNLQPYFPEFLRAKLETIICIILAPKTIFITRILKLKCILIPTLIIIMIIQTER
jgi:hypothetical protein